MSHANAIANEYRYRINWIQERLLEMANETEGKIPKLDAEALIYNRYNCSPDAVRRYLKTLEGKRFLQMNDTHIFIPEAKKVKQ